jgi:hypothetical protein
MSNLKSKSAKNILSCFISLIMIMVFVTPFLVQAQSGGNPLGPITIVNPFKSNTIEGFIKTIVNEILIPIGGVVAVMMIIYAGYLYVTARGNPGKIETAHKALLWAVIGAAILLGAWVISNAITATIAQLKAT